MAKVKIQGHSSGTGVLTVTAPNTSTDRTITLPDSTGTILDENSSLPAANLTGNVADARISTLTSSKLSGALPSIDGSSLTSVTPADTSSFYAYKGVVQANIAIDTSTTVTYDSEAFDKGGDFASNTFTAPTTGKYVLIWTLRVDQLDSAADLFQFAILTSNREMRLFLDPDFMAADCTRFPVCISGVFDMDASDTAYCYIRQDGGTAQMDIHYSFFSGYFLGS